MTGNDLELYEATVEGGTKALVETFAGPLVETGEWLRDVVRFHRWKSQVKMLRRAKEFLDHAGVDPEAVSLRTLVPLIESSGFEDESADSMTDRWAALLANAAAGTRANADVLPSFISILGEMSPEEAAILDGLYASGVPLDRSTYRTWPLPVDAIRAKLGISTATFPVYAENLIRLGLCTRTYTETAGLSFQTGPPGVRGVLESLSPTELGSAFVSACHPPEPLEEVTSVD